MLHYGCVFVINTHSYYTSLLVFKRTTCIGQHFIPKKMPLELQIHM
jgi:hypothetical protein